MRFPLRLLFAVVAVLISIPALQTPGFARETSVQPPSVSYDSLITAAHQLADEGSWAAAKARYAEALPLAPGADSRRWCELWIENATWRSEPAPAWEEREPWRKQHLAVYDALAASYSAGESRDAFWIALLTSRADFEQTTFLVAESAQHRLAVADHLAAQPPSPAAARAYVAFLQHTFDVAPEWNGHHLAGLASHFAHGTRVGATPDDRAWCQWQLARLDEATRAGLIPSQSQLAERAENWRTALTVAAGTTWGPVVRAEEFLWRTTIGYSSTAAPNTPADIPAILTELAAVRTALATRSDPISTRCRQQLDQLKAQLDTPQLILTARSRLLPGEPLRFSYGAAGIENLSWQLWRLELEAWAKLPQQIGNAERGDHYSDYLPTGHNPVGSGLLSLPSSESRAWKSEVIEAVSSLEPGLYLLLARGESATGETVFRRHKLIVSDLGGIAISGNGVSGQLLLTHGPDQQPLASTLVHGVTAIEEEVEAWSAQTDTEGIVEFPTSHTKSGTVVAMAGDHPVCFERFRRTRPTQTWLVDVITDRELYRPGETVRWKIIARERRGGRFVPINPIAPLRMSVNLHGETLVADSQLELNAFGTTHGEIAIPATARPGSASLELRRGDASDEPGARQFEDMFLVDNFVPPAVAAKIELVSGAKSLRPGHEIVVRVNASYFSGGPVANAPVECRFEPSFHLYDGSPSRAAREKWAEQLRQEVHKATTDSGGHAEFRLQLPTDFSETFNLTASATVMPEGGQPARARQSLQITATGFMLDPLGWDSPRLAQPGQPVTFTAKVRDGTGNPAAFTGIARLIELRWSEAWLKPDGQVASEQDVADTHGSAKAPIALRPRAGWKNLHADYVEIPVAQQPVEADAEGQVTSTFTLPRAGLFQLRLEDDGVAIDVRPIFLNLGLLAAPNRFHGGPEPQSAKKHPLLSVVAVGEDLSPLALSPFTAAVIAPERITAGDALKTLVILPIGVSHAWLTIGGENKIVTVPVSAKGRIAFCTPPQLPSFLGMGSLMLSYQFRHGSGGIARTTFSVPPDRSTLAVAVLPEHLEQRPGNKARLRITASRAHGTPSPSEISLSVSDEAVNRLTRGDTGFIPTSHFLDARQAIHLHPAWERDHTRPRLDPLPDPRPGAVLNRSFWDEETIELASFSIGNSSRAGSASFDRPPCGFAVMGALSPPLRADAARLISPDSFVQSTEPPPSEDSIQIRRHFASTAFWAPEVVTDEKGEATVEFTYPDNLTEWRIDAYAVGDDLDSFGRASTTTKTSLPFQSRLQLPRFLIAGDTADASAVLVNRTDDTMKAHAELKATGAVALAAPAPSPEISVAKQAEARTYWPVKAVAAGSAEFTLTANAAAERNAMALTLPVLEDGLQQETAALGRLDSKAKKTTLALELPKPLDPARTRVSLQLSPNPAITLLDALPYLIDYPYGCVEQTMSRFLPAIIVRKTLADLGLDEAAVEKRILATETIADHERREQTAGLRKLDDVVAQSLARLIAAKRHDGFGWWPDAPASDLWMTAYVTWGLSLAQSAGVDLPSPLFDATASALFQQLRQVKDTDDAVAFGWAAVACNPIGVRPDEARRLFDGVFAQREKLSASGRAWLALASRFFGTSEQRGILLGNLANGAERGSAGGLGDTVHWGAMQNDWRATHGAVESTAVTLFALLELDPQNPLIESAANWLVLNRRSAHWASTRDTTFAVLALERFLQARGGLDASGELEVHANGRVLQRVRYDRASWLTADSSIAVPATALRVGKNEITLHRSTGAAPVYAVALASSWAASEGLQPATSIIAVARGFERQKAEPTLIGTLRITPEPLPSSGQAATGEQVTARVTLTVPTELEYLMIEVPKPAGCEPLNPLSGWDARLMRVEPAENSSPTRSGARSIAPASRTVLPPDDDPGLTIYREERDDRSVFFIDHLESGTWEIRFGLRAITAGDFRALPVEATAMYVPEIRANSDARRLTIERTTPPRTE